MANVIYDKYKEALLNLEANADLTGGSVKISLVDTGITTFSSTQEFYSDLVDIATGELSVANLDNITVTNGVVDADNVTFVSAANTALDAEALVIWIDTANTATSRVVAWMDTNIDGLPISPTGGDIDIVWSTSGIFKL
jgi:hypothetical protein